MEDEFKLNLTREEAIKMDEQIEQMLAAHRNCSDAKIPAQYSARKQAVEPARDRLLTRCTVPVLRD